MAGPTKKKCVTRIPHDWPQFPDRANFGQFRKGNRRRKPERKAHDFVVREVYNLGDARRDWQKYLNSVANLSPTPKVR